MAFAQLYGSFSPQGPDPKSPQTAWPRHAERASTLPNLAPTYGEAPPSATPLKGGALRGVARV